MKKLKIYSLMVFIALGLAASAQNQMQDANTQSDELNSLRNEVSQLRSEIDARNKKETEAAIWGKQKSIKVGFVSNTWSPEIAAFAKPQSNYGLLVGLTKTYFLHHNPIAGCLKFGIEATWFDIAQTFDLSEYDDVPSIGHYGNDYGYLNYYIDQDIRYYQTDAAIGIGISANVATFFKSTSKSVRAKLYCNFLPSLSYVRMIAEGYDKSENFAFVPYYTFGINLQWRSLAIFFEGHRGTGKYRLDNLHSYPENGLYKDKISCLNSGFRVGLGYCF